MKYTWLKRQNLFFLLFVSSYCLYANDPQAITWFKGSLEQLKISAKREGKPYFMVFYTNWCTPCQDMDESVFIESGLSQMANQHFIAYKVNSDESNRGGEDIARAYDVLFFPTIIVFSSQGELLERRSGFLSAGEMKTLLASHAVKNTTPPRTPEVVDITPAITPVPSTRPPGEAPAKTGSDGLYQFNLSRMPSQGYGLQVGVYADYRNVLKEVEIIQQQMNQPVLVNINQLGNRAVFKVLIGPFESSGDAEESGKMFKAKTGRDGLLVSLTNY
ncbi:MAG: DUF255 domain-containing protein [Bacteroidetes bacterium]|nr:MAG: DUF255 domain-containing protein [Bacteroidota bacterium]